MISSTELIGNSVELLTSAVSAVAHDKINKIKIDGITTLENNVRLLALEILNLNNDLEMILLNNWLNFYSSY